MPKVTVFIPVYNRARYVRTAVDSILAQSFTDFELLLVDDGSTDDSVAILRSYTDCRIRIEENGQNLGVPRTRNRGLELARGEYLALLDSDDYSYPTRLAKQVDFLDRHPDYAEIGAWNRAMDESGKPLAKVKFQPVGAEETRATMLFRCAIKNRSVMGRTALLRQLGYRESFPRCQDYDLHVRLAEQHHIGNLPEVLVLGRLHEERWTRQTEDLGNRAKMQIMADQLSQLGLEPSEDELRRHLLLAHKTAASDALQHDQAYLGWAGDWLERLRQRNRITRRYAEPAFDRVIGEIWLGVCLRGAGKLGARALFSYARSSLPKGLRPLLERRLYRFGLSPARL